VTPIDWKRYYAKYKANKTWSPLVGDTY